jgi:starch synthase (maltosyl-transferring)
MVLFLADYLYEHESDKLWDECIMHKQGNDKFGGEFISKKNGFYFFKIEAWKDHFARWQHEVGKKIKAGLRSPSF